ncbi:xanthine dehydrogenase family protein molybdopterin-binding subunit [Paramagnetospirillum kuznetsovii]|uniref:Xanthine dehydrogenase family protein molybdopterin-binding subunit n=1 Tax=Paramagnetospirillum kuznetsovii TaxID=2053833 RepID=A0A364NV07_9PROT|nr:molybdopterin cofactor-binding domain-containing protein [Paramagnetospirillum kuznetsovii]RAU20921.1 xanthine dehydrogenase family protein molybdopterin-binding subunit [Paramagnetospirillum kuznetsovii]
MTAVLSRRDLLRAGGALVVGFALPRPSPAQAAMAKTVDATELDGFLAISPDGSVTVYCGKVDLGQGLRIAIPQMAAEELGLGVERITLIEGDTALTPDQGPTAGSTGIAKGGVQIRQAAATARQALIRLAAARFDVPEDGLDIVDGDVRSLSGEGPSLGIGDLVGEHGFGLKLDPKAPLRSPASYKVVGKPLPRPDVPAKVTGRHTYVHDFRLPGMLHGKVIRPPAVGASLLGVDESALKAFKGVRIVRIKDFLGVVAASEWDALRAADALKATWSQTENLIGHEAVRDAMKAGPFVGEDIVVSKGDAATALADPDVAVLKAEYYWPVQSHASMGPSCAVADVKSDSATLWTASQATHRFRPAYAAMLGLPVDMVRLIYLDGSGCYGMNGHDDACADAALLSKAVGKPVRVQWSREDELGWDPKGPPQLLALEATPMEGGVVAGWRTEMWLPKATAGLPNVPLLAAQAAGIDQPMGLVTGLITQNGDPPYGVAAVQVKVNWLADAPLRPSNIRAPGKIANSFAVEGFFDELCNQAKVDGLITRLQMLKDLRGIIVLSRAASLIGWKPRPSPNPESDGVGRGVAYVHYKHSETYVAVAMEVSVDRDSGKVAVRRVACAHDCGLVINPDALRLQIEGAIIQTLSRTLLEEVTFDTKAVTSTDWASYPILGFADIPDITVDLINQPNQPPMGGGEAAATPIPAALANAIFDACGARVRTVPITPERVKAALAEADAKDKLG